MTLRIRNWEQWQSYRSDRGVPPWIKVHRRLLCNEQWAGLSDEEKGQLVTLWIIAADRDGELPGNPTILRKIGGLDVEPNIKKLISFGFLESDAKVTPERRQGGCPDTETEVDTETETDIDRSASAEPPAKEAAKPKRGSRICPPAFTLTLEDETWARRNFPEVDVALEFQKFKDHEYRTPKRDWPRAFRNWIRKAAEIARLSGRQNQFDADEWASESVQ